MDFNNEAAQAQATLERLGLLQDLPSSFDQ
jgi:hypothetical protein